MAFVCLVFAQAIIPYVLVHSVYAYACEHLFIASLHLSPPPPLARSIAHSFFLQVVFIQRSCFTRFEYVKTQKKNSNKKQMKNHMSVSRASFLSKSFFSVSLLRIFLLKLRSKQLKYILCFTIKHNHLKGKNEINRLIIPLNSFVKFNPLDIIQFRFRSFFMHSIFFFLFLYSSHI